MLYEIISYRSELSFGFLPPEKKEGNQYNY
jgi:hypothetical protein